MSSVRGECPFFIGWVIRFKSSGNTSVKFVAKTEGVFADKNAYFREMCIIVIEK